MDYIYVMTLREEFKRDPYLDGIYKSAQNLDIAKLYQYKAAYRDDRRKVDLFEVVILEKRSTKQLSWWHTMLFCGLSTVGVGLMVTVTEDGQDYVVPVVLAGIGLIAVGLCFRAAWRANDRQSDRLGAEVGLWPARLRKLG